MAAQKPWRDWLYLVIIGLQLFGMLALDLVAFYPKALWQAPSSPLHFLVSLRAWHVASSGDPFFAETASSRPWFHAFLYLEGLVQLPLAAFLVARLSRRSRISGPAELAGLVFGCLTAMGSVACVAELAAMGPGEVSVEKKSVLLYGTYAPYAVIPAFMAVDMYLRLLPRVQASEAKAKTV